MPNNEGKETAIFRNMRLFNGFVLLFLISVSIHGQTRGTIPEELLRPNRGEGSRYPEDTIIGELGQGRASSAAYSCAVSLAEGFLSGQVNNPALVSVNPDLRESYLYALGKIAPRSFRLGGGREEADGAVSFLVRFIGREYGITGELYIRYITRQVEEDDGEVTVTGNWVFEELLLEEAKNRETEREESSQLRHRLDLLPYERFF